MAVNRANVNKSKSGISTPCTLECSLVEGRCAGCGRTQAHLRNWLEYTEQERLKIMQELKKESVQK